MFAYHFVFFANISEFLHKDKRGKKWLLISFFLAKHIQFCLDRSNGEKIVEQRQRVENKINLPWPKITAV